MDEGVGTKVKLGRPPVIVEQVMEQPGPGNTPVVKVETLSNPVAIVRNRN